ncbi:hypothetical protein QTO34_005088 [Cnephaeus nilssonii]|uniref:Ubiquitin-related modifier 1 n=1 Tax=Cnephaeus nilssonii TaxID=3371016 RepID=A0AA40HMY9_CNENI|nr:hypothetical protein QTO34_005088 [Eptesicus nilssonii]
MAAPLSVEVEFGEVFAGTDLAVFLWPSFTEVGGAPVRRCKKNIRSPCLDRRSPVRDIRNLLVWIKKNLLKERPELFIQGDSVRPGILVLINDADWELLGELDYQLQDQDSVLFISTLHGG